MTYFIDFYGTLIDSEHQVYPDVPEMLRMLGNEAIIITSATKEMMRPDVETTLTGTVRLTVLYTNGKRKADYLSAWTGYNGGPALLVDDNPKELAACAEAFPSMKLYEMRRDGAAGDGRWPVVHSLSDLP